MLLLFTKVFFKECELSLRFFKKGKIKTSLLKAPSRHKKFFHQVFFEVFFLKFFLVFKKNFKKQPNCFTNIFKKIDKLIFKKIGTNVVTREKVKIVFFSKQKIPLFQFN